MREKEIYLIRHGETEYNKLGIVQGSGVDSSLNDTGINQSTLFFEKYKDIQFKKIYTSALKRTHQTVQLFLEKGISHEILPGLNEISWGEKEGKIPNSVENKYYSDLLNTWKEGNTHLAAIGGESPEEVLVRQKIALEIILENENENLILVAMHGRAMRILLAHLSGKHLSDMDEFPHMNTCLYKLKYSYHHNSFEIITMNDTSHLDLVLSDNNLELL